ncbi:MAG: hypothetical protein JJ920_18890 [Roseitalea sp.]|jgi:hypothetical protein|nr:hypothetical protein [Roseitalea sp.]MBO6722222.1 hypothetical protein [Roseitalea sp.]MBO6744986.1 hypothetical protein [Roseitalea sp.]
MYVLKHGIKHDPERRWNLPDRIFFGHGACHILAGMYLRLEPLPGFHAEKITPEDGFSGNHVYVTNGRIAFDYHGYSSRSRLLAHHWKGWSGRCPGWNASVEPVDYDLLDKVALNDRKMLGPDQYWGDPMPRAKRFIDQRDHETAARRAAWLKPAPVP